MIVSPSRNPLGNVNRKSYVGPPPQTSFNLIDSVARLTYGLFRLNELTGCGSGCEVDSDNIYIIMVTSPIRR